MSRCRLTFEEKWPKDYLYKPSPAIKKIRKMLEQEKGVVKPYWCPFCEKQIDALIVRMTDSGFFLGCPYCLSTAIEGWDSDKPLFNPSRR